MREAVIVSTARTGIGKAYRGSLNNLESPSLAGHVIREAVKRAKLDPEEARDVVLGAAQQQGTQGGNFARMAAIAGGLPVTTSGISVNCNCASGLVGIATAAKQIMVDGMDIVVGGGMESISLVQNKHANKYRVVDPNLIETLPGLYMSMIETADVVAKRYNVSRESQDEYSLESQNRTAAAQDAGKFDDEIIPITTTMTVVDRETKEESKKEVTLTKDECNRPSSTAEGLAKLQPVFPEGHITAVMLASCQTVLLSVYSWKPKWRKKEDFSRWGFTAVLQWLVANLMKWGSVLFMRYRVY